MLDQRNRWHTDPAYKAKMQAYAKERRRLAGELVDNIRNSPCADCGGNFPAVAMDFDHVRGDKRGDIATMVADRESHARILAEIAKCDVICANCHRVRTAKRLNSRRHPAS